MYLIILKALAIITLIISAKSSSLCPSGKIDFEKFQMLDSGLTKHSSQYQDLLFEISTQNSSSIKLKGYKIIEVESGINPTFDIQNFSITATAKSKIIFVSQKGNCIVVDNGVNFVGYSTLNNAFTQVQSVLKTNFTTLQANQDCGIIRIIGSNSQKVYLNSIQNDVLQFPTGAVFDSELFYGIDSFGHLFIRDGNSYKSQSLNTGTYLSNPISVTNSEDYEALILITNDTSSGSYMVTILDTSDRNVSYHYTFQSSDYNGQLKFEIEKAGDYVVVRDQIGLIKLLSIDRFDDLEIDEIELESSANYSSRFDASGFVSLDDDLIFSYSSKKVTYFQSFDNVLYFLGDIEVDIEQTFKTYLTENSPNKLRMLIGLLSPSQIDICYKLSTTEVTDETVVDQMDQDVVTSVTLTDGTVLKCQPQCVKCTITGACSVCSLGYVNTQSACVYCGGCKSCNPSNPTVCLSCFLPQILNDVTGECQLPTCDDVNCQYCSTNGTCAACAPGYSLFGNTCAQCPAGCSSCAVSALICDADLCLQNYVYFKNPTTSVALCVECATGCISCSSTDITNCTACNYGFFAVVQAESGSLRCSVCIPNCYICKSATTCTRCNSGLVLSEDNTQCLLACNSNCLACNQNNPNVCLKCYIGTRLNATTGICDVALSCNSTQSCITCSEGYALHRRFCIACLTTDPYCLSCSASQLTRCSKCATGYYLASDYTCTPCKGKCAACLGKNSCYACKTGNFLTNFRRASTGICTACVSPCATCFYQPYICSSCIANYTLIGTKCRSLHVITISIEIDIRKIEFVIISTTITNFILNLAINARIGRKLTFRRSNFVIFRIVTGSAILSSELSLDSAQDASDVSNAVKSGLDAQKDFDGYSILRASVSTTSNNNTNGNNGTNGTTDNGNNGGNSTVSSTDLGILLGILIPLGILIIIGVIVFIVKMKQRREDELQKGKPVSDESIKQTMKSMAEQPEATQKI